jgi:predicted O-methyltransferase YrrM
MVKKHVVIAIPAYSGTIHLPTFRSLLGDITTLLKRGDEISIIDECGSAYIDDTRAYILADFLKTEGTDMVYVDHDLVWEAGALVKIVDAPVDMCATVYRKRSDKVEYPVRLHPDKGELWSDPETGLLEVAGVGFGLVKCSRAMLERMVEAYSELKIAMPDGDTICAVFEPIRIGNLRLHEDFAFCERFRQIGGQVWVDPEILTAHIGSKPFVGHWGAHLRGKAGVTFEHCLGQISRAEDNSNTYFELVEEWGNGNWAGSHKMLSMVAALARKADGPIVEFGSGLTTLVMRAACDQSITSFEQSAEWAKKVLKRLPGPIELVVGMVDGFYDVSHVPDKSCALAVVDGPLDSRDRARAFPELERVLRPGGVFVIDDLQFCNIAADLTEWAKGKANFETFTGDTRKFAIGMMNEA